MKSIGLLALLAVTTAVAATSIACGSSNSSTPTTPSAQPMAYNGQPGAYPANTGYPAQPGYTAQPNGYPAQPGYTAQPTQPGAPTAQPTATTPGAFPGIPGFPAQPSNGGSASGTAQSLDPSVAALAVGPLTIFANTAAPGMQKEGSTVAGNFQPGQTLESTFTFTPGKCYTLLAQGAGVTDVGLEMQYVTPLPGLNPSIGTNSSKGAQVAMGAGANCLKPMSPFPANAKFIVKANAGAGLIAAQLYSK